MPKANTTSTIPTEQQEAEVFAKIYVGRFIRNVVEELNRENDK